MVTGVKWTKIVGGVALFGRAWIEIILSIDLLLIHQVALFGRAWIEIGMS